MIGFHFLQLKVFAAMYTNTFLAFVGFTFLFFIKRTET